jgi:pimeloyl-ACP methyl ester carboxylesterase
MKRIAVLIALFSAFTFTSFAETTAEVKWATLDGAKIRYLDTGGDAKKALVFVHCWTCNSDFWRDNLGAFSQYRVIALDLPGHGQSEKPKIEYTIEHFAKAIDTVMRDAGVKKAVLVGHSMGTPITRRFYELYPKKTLGIVTVDGALIPMGPRDEIDKFFQPMLANYRSSVTTFLDGMLQPTWPSVKPFIRKSMLATEDHVGASAMRNMIDDSFAQHGKIDVPVLAVMAPSPYWPKDLEEQYRDVAPDIDFQMWTGVSHFLQLERPREFNGQVKSFIMRKRLL